MPVDPNTMYRWRTWTNEQRQEILKERKSRKNPFHSPPHKVSEETSLYLVTAACFEHRSIIGFSESRLRQFSFALCDVIAERCNQVFAWVVLPNHYHFLAQVNELKLLFSELGKLHGRKSFEWNAEESKRGRQVWCKAAETAMKSEGHFFATLSYVLNNPVHHGYCKKWPDWPYGSANEYLQNMGREKALRIWQSYPLYDYGQSWDPPEL